TSVTGTYHIKVIGYNNAFSSSQCYTLKVETGSANFKEGVPAESQKAIPQSGMSVYPNPASSEVNLDYASEEETDAVISIIDQAGRTSLNKKIHLNAGANHSKFDVSALPAGFYFIKLITNDGAITE